MTGPWERYQPQQAAAGPWQRYGAQPDQPEYSGLGMNTTAGMNEALYAVAGAPVDLMRGTLNLGIRGVNRLTGSEIDQIPENSFGGSRHIAETLGRVAPQLDPENTTANTTAERIARGTGQGVAGTIGPAAIVGGLARAGTLGREGAELGARLAGRSSSVGAAGADAFAGAVAGAGASAAMEAVPERYAPLAAVAGGLTGGAVGSAATGIPGLARETVRAGRQYARPLTAGGRERMAGEQLRDAATDPQALRESLDAAGEPLIPGSEPTTGQLSGDMGVLAAERGAQSRYPAEFQQRRADQNSARREALDGLQPNGAAENVTRALRQRLEQIDRDTLGDLDMTTETAVGRQRLLGPQVRPEDAGEEMRRSLQRRRDQAKAKERRLWEAVDPDGSFALSPQDARATAQRILSDLPTSARRPGSEEAAIYGVVERYGDVMPFREIAALRSRVSEAMAYERAHGGDQAHRRLTQLRGAIESDLENAVSRRAIVEEQMVARGQMREEDSIISLVRGWADDWRADRAATATGTGDSSSVGGRGAGRASGSIGVSGAARETGLRPASAPRDPGLPQDAGRGRSAQDQISLAELRSASADDANVFFRSRDGQTFVQREPGNPDLGAAPDIETPGAELPIRVRRSDMLRHIDNAAHQNDAAALGYPDTWAMVRDISANWSEMRQGRYGRVQLVKPGQANGVAVVEIAPSDDMRYWRIVSAHRNRDDQLGETILVREHTPDAASGNAASLVNGPPQSRQDPAFARDRTDPEYSVSRDVSEGGRPSGGLIEGASGLRASDPRSPTQPADIEYRAFDEAAKGRLDEATAATRNRVNTFDNRNIGPILARPADHAPYTMDAARVASRVFQPGANGFERVQQFRRAAGTKRANEALEAYAVDSLRKRALNDDGTLDPNKLKAWVRSHADALRAFPELNIRLDSATDAVEVMAGMAARRKAALDDAHKGALGKLIGAEDPADVSRIIGGLFSRQDSVRQFGQIRRAIGDDKEALEGLRKATADYLSTRLLSNTEAATSGQTLFKSDQLQTFVRSNRNALRTVFSAEEVSTLEAIAADLQRTNRSLTAVKIPGQSNTVQDALAVTSGDSGVSILGKLITGGMATGGALAGGMATGSVPGAALGAGGAALVSALRQNGIQQVDELVRDALLHPSRARMLLSKVPPKNKTREEAMYRSLARRYVKTAIGTGVIVNEARPEEPTQLPPMIVTPRDPLTDALMSR